jgi:2-polyprenyl-6-methoxyphenol hydroxylase-like FAD-dependent oxidoreductase
MGPRRRALVAPHRPPLVAHAVVVGAGPAGLAAALALGRHAERVTVVERDDVADRVGELPCARPGPHAQLVGAAALAALEHLVPGFRDDAVAAGAAPLVVPAPGGGPGLAASRELLTAVLRRRALASPQVVVRAGLEARGLAVDGGGRVRAVEVGSRRAGGGRVGAIDGDLVVDAGGRCSPAARWLAAAGLVPPTETVGGGPPACASRLYRRAGGRERAAAVVVEPCPPGRPRGAALVPIEGDRWLLALAGPAEVPVGEEVFAAAACSLGEPAVSRVVAGAAPLSPVTSWVPLPVRWRHYEALERPLAGFLAAGGALCGPGPLHGGSVAVAAASARALDRALAVHLATHPDLDGLGAGAQQAVAAAASAIRRRTAGYVPPGDAGGSQMPRRWASSSRW